MHCQAFLFYICDNKHDWNAIKNTIKNQFFFTKIATMCHFSQESHIKYLEPKIQLFAFFFFKLEAERFFFFINNCLLILCSLITNCCLPILGRVQPLAFSSCIYSWFYPNCTWIIPSVPVALRANLIDLLICLIIPLQSERKGRWITFFWRCLHNKRLEFLFETGLKKGTGTKSVSR